MMSKLAVSAIRNLLFALIWNEVSGSKTPLSSLASDDCDNCRSSYDIESDIDDRQRASFNLESDLNGLDIFYTFFLATVIVASVLGNGLVGIVLYRKRTLSPSSRLVFVLCGSNFILSLFVLPFNLASSVLKAWVFGQCWCWISAFLIHLVVSASNVTLAAIAVDRYFAIVKPMSYAVNITSAKTVLVLMGIWTLAVVINLPPLFRWPEITYQKSISVCLANLQDNPIYSLLHLFWDILLPAIIMTTSYGCILKVARSKYKTTNIGTLSDAVRQCDTAMYSSILNPNRPTIPQVDMPANRRGQYVRKPSWLSIVLQSPVKGFAVISCILGVFFLYWLPYVVSMATVFSGSITNSCWQRQLAHYIFILSFPSYPVIYGLLNRSIRKDLSMWLRSNNNQPICGVRKLRKISTSTSNPNSVTTVGVLDYTPPFSQWQYSEKAGQRKASDDSGRFSLQLDENEIEKPQDKSSFFVASPQ